MRDTLWHTHSLTCLRGRTFIHFGPTALECHVKLKLPPGKWSEFRKKIRFIDGSSFIFLSVQFFCLLEGYFVLCGSDGDPWCLNLHHTHTHTHTHTTHTHTHRGLPYGKQSSGRGNEACVNSIVPVAFCLAASEETTGERKKEKGEVEGVLKDDCRGREGGRCVRLSGWMGKMPCVHAITFGCFFVFFLGCAIPSLIVSSACCCVRSAAGMNMSPVSRLKKTWSKVKTAKFDILEVSLHEKFETWSRWTNVNTVFCPLAQKNRFSST